MQNITLISLHIMSLTSLSPFYSIRDQYNSYSSSTILNSRFSNMFSSIIYSYTNYHKTIIQNSMFLHSLQTPLKFDSAGNCQINNIDENIQQPIENKNIKGSDFGDWRDKRAYFTSASVCGHIKIIFCTFQDCSSVDAGGSLFINQDSEVILHSNEFIRSKTSNSKGGAALITKSFKQDADPPNDEKVSKLNIQYCCFCQCCPINQDNLLGVALFAAGVDTVFSFLSTVDCPLGNGVRAKGAQFDIQATNVRATNINISGGNSKYCGGIEYRNAIQGYFRFQTISNIAHCRFATCYTSVLIQDMQITHYIYDNNYLENMDTSITNALPALVHIRENDVKIDQFYFVNFKGIPESYLISKLADSKNNKVTLTNCLSDNSIDESKIYKVENNNQWLQGTVEIKNSIITPEITQLNLGECEGRQAPISMTVEVVVPPSVVVTPVPQDPVTSSPVVVTSAPQDPVTSSPVVSKDTPIPQTKTPEPVKPVTSAPSKETTEPSKPSIITSESFESLSTTKPSNAPTSSNIQVVKTSTQDPDISSILEEISYVESDVNETDIDINENSKKEKGKTNLGVAVGVPVASVAAVGGGVAIGVLMYIKRKAQVGAESSD